MSTDPDIIARMREGSIRVYLTAPDDCDPMVSIGTGPFLAAYDDLAKRLADTERLNHALIELLKALEPLRKATT